VVLRNVESIILSPPLSFRQWGCSEPHGLERPLVFFFSVILQKTIFLTTGLKKLSFSCHKIHPFVL